PRDQVAAYVSGGSDDYYAHIAPPLGLAVASAILIQHSSASNTGRGALCALPHGTGVVRNPGPE
ncbi:MAG TPA: hypothetical protein VLI70_11410, partial [Micrococcaceae bacterium]|nr:hypothetical protein [Micrococcaceae bacterium]